MPRSPGTPRPSGCRHSGSGSPCRLLLDPEGHGSFEQVPFHPQPGVVRLDLAQAGPFVAGQPLALATVDAVLLDPVAERGVVDPQLTSDLRGRLAARADQLDRITLELLGEPSTPPPAGLALFLCHADILSLEVSGHRG